VAKFVLLEFLVNWADGTASDPSALNLPLLEGSVNDLSFANIGYSISLIAASGRYCDYRRARQNGVCLNQGVGDGGNRSIREIEIV
jgi:hypothetical protein